MIAAIVGPLFLASWFALLLNGIPQLVLTDTWIDFFSVVVGVISGALFIVGWISKYDGTLHSSWSSD